MVIESDRENQGHDEEQDQDVFIGCSDYQQEEKADEENDEFGGDDVGENCAYKEAVFALEEGSAVRAVMPDVKWLGNNPRLTTRRTTQSDSPTQNPLDLFRIYFQGVCLYYAKESLPQRRKGAKEN